MSEANLTPGKRFRMYISDGTTGVSRFKFACLATTMKLDRKKNLEDATVADCNNPLATPAKKSIVRSREWSAPISGFCDASRIVALETAFNSDDPVEICILLDLPAADGGRGYVGTAHVTDLSLDKADNGVVKFSAGLSGHGSLAAAAADVLAALLSAP